MALKLYDLNNIQNCNEAVENYLTQQGYLMYDGNRELFSDRYYSPDENGSYEYYNYLYSWCYGNEFVGYSVDYKNINGGANIYFFIKEAVYSVNNSSVNVTSEYLNKWISFVHKGYDYSIGRERWGIVEVVPPKFLSDRDHLCFQYEELQTFCPESIYVNIKRKESTSERFYLEGEEVYLFEVILSLLEDSSNSESSDPDEPEEILPNIAELDLNKINTFIPYLEEKLIELKNFDSQLTGWRYNIQCGESYELYEDSMYVPPATNITILNPLEIAYIDCRFSNGEIKYITAHGEHEMLYYFTKEQEFEMWDNNSMITKYFNITSDMLNKWMVYTYLYYDQDLTQSVYGFVEIVENKTLFSPKALEEEQLWTIFDSSEEIIWYNRKYNITAARINTGYSMEMGGTNRFSGDIELLQKFYECCKVETSSNEEEQEQYTVNTLLNDMARIIQTAEGDRSRKIRGIDMPVRLQAVIDNAGSGTGGNGGSGDAGVYDIRNFEINEGLNIPTFYEKDKDSPYQLEFDWEEMFNEENMSKFTNPNGNWIKYRYGENTHITNSIFSDVDLYQEEYSSNRLYIRIPLMFAKGNGEHSVSEISVDPRYVHEATTTKANPLEIYISTKGITILEPVRVYPNFIMNGTNGWISGASENNYVIIHKQHSFGTNFNNLVDLIYHLRENVKKTTIVIPKDEFYINTTFGALQFYDYDSSSYIDIDPFTLQINPSSTYFRGFEFIEFAKGRFMSIDPLEDFPEGIHNVSNAHFDSECQITCGNLDVITSILNPISFKKAE